MIVVTGANGQLGRAVVEGLLARLDASRIGASVRDLDVATALVERGVDVRAGDFDKPDALTAAFSGAAQVLVVSVNKLGEEALRMHRAAIVAARETGARVLYTSHMGARADSPFAPAPDHAATEGFLAEGGGAFTSLRHGFYAESALHMIEHDLIAGEIRAPEDGPVSWTTRADLAEADAVILAEDGRLDGITPPLTALEAVTMADLAAIGSELTGREIKRVIISDEEWRAAKIAQGVPARMAEMLLGFYHAARRGDFAATDTTLEALLGRPPRTMREVLASFLDSNSLQ